MTIYAGSGGWRTIPDVVAACAEHRPDASLLLHPDGPAITAAQLLDRTRRGAALIAARGVRRGDFVAVEAGSMSWSEAAISFFAVTWLGAAAVLTTGDAVLRQASERIGVTALITSADADGRGAVTLSPAELALAPELAGPPAAEPDDRLDIVFTSGTTGVPKPVASTHAQWTRSVRPEMMASQHRRVVAHTGVPIVVSGGLHGILLNHLARGVSSLAASTVMELMGASDRHDVSELHMTPHAARSVVRQLAPGQAWTQRVRVIRVVGGPVPAEVADGLTECFPRARVVSLYGLTEGGAALCVKRLDGRRAQDSIGRPAPGTEVRVLGTDGGEVPAGQVGELAVRTVGARPLTYYREESLNAEWIPDEWARTGDMGFVAPDGNLRLVGRAKELLFLRGGRVSPEAIEESLAKLVPADVDFAVAGIRSDGSWDRIAVFLAGAGGDRLTEAIRKLEGMKGPFRPDVVKLTGRIPRGPFGKPLRRLLVREITADES